MVRALLSALALLLCLGACVDEDGVSALLPDQPGAQPLPLSEDAAYLLQVFDLDDSAQLLALQAPEGAVGLEVTVYRLGDDLAWKKTGGGEVIGGSPEDVSGVFAMEAGQDQVVSLHFHGGGVGYAIETDPIPTPEAYGYSMNVFLTEFQEMELDEEIPIALLAYDVSSFSENLPLSDFFTPANLEGINLVQAVTLTFTSSPAL